MHVLLFLILTALVIPVGVAAGNQTLPSPLSLADALRLAVPEVPELVGVEARREAAEAGLLLAQALNGARLDLRASARAIEPAYKSRNDDWNDSSAQLYLSKRLYDFGYAEALRSAAAQGRRASDLEWLAARQENRLTIMRAFFDVLLADLEYARDNEAMSIAYVALDKARDQSELGRLSDVELLRLEADYQETRRRRLLSEQRQRLSRSRLAIAMGRPGELASELQPPAIELEAESAQDFNAYWSRVEAQNPGLRALAQRLEAARHRLASARASDAPVLSMQLDASVYNRNSSTTHPLGGGLQLEMPLYSGGRLDAAVKEAQSTLTTARAELLKARLDLHQKALQAWLDRDRLRSDLQAIRVEGDYRDLYLDRSRALYELEVKTDLGDAMVRISDVRLKQAQALYAWAMNEATIKAMTGTLLEENR